MQPSEQKNIGQAGDDRLGRLYVSFYNLVENPFRSYNDPKYFWLGEKHLEALAHLKLGIEEDKGIMVLTGEEGVGKSVLTNCLLRVVDCDILAVPYYGKDARANDFFKFLAETFSLGDISNSKSEVLVRFRKVLFYNHEKNRKVLLIFNNANDLDREILEQARLLSNIETEGRKLLSVLLVGTTGFLEILGQSANKALLQRVAIRCRLDQLSENETVAYIRHRIKAAGGVRELFTSEAIREFYLLTGGNPGLINIVCDHVLMQGYFDRLSLINDEVIKRYARHTSDIFDGDTKKISELKVSSKDSRERKTDSKRTWVWVIPFQVMVLALLFWFSISDLPRTFRGEPPTTEFGTIYFESNATVPLDIEAAKLEKIMVFAKENSTSHIRITGHSDNVGSREVNIRVSRKRAEQIRDYLVAKGIKLRRIEVVAMGPDRPIANNETSEGRRKNRRVEIEMIR